MELQRGLGAILLGVMLVSVTAFSVWYGWRRLPNAFVRRYFKSEYQPLTLRDDLLTPSPGAGQIDDVPWIGEDFPACQSVSLQMIAAQHGEALPRSAIEFLMGFSYGFSAIPGSSGFFPSGIDPEIGLRDAAPYVGLRRCYYVTDDPALFVHAVRHFIAQGMPVRLALDMGALYDDPAFIAHSEVIIGFDVDGFRYYEPVCTPPATCEAGSRPVGEPGIHVSTVRLLEAVRRLGDSFGYPWRYSLTIFEPQPAKTDLQPVWARLAAATLGGNRYGPPTGVIVLDRLAEQVERGARNLDLKEASSALEVAMRFRKDNATYLRKQFAGDDGVEKAAGACEAAAHTYAQIAEKLSDAGAGCVQGKALSALIRTAAEAERLLGNLLLAKSRSDAAA